MALLTAIIGFVSVKKAKIAAEKNTEQLQAQNVKDVTQEEDKPNNIKKEANVQGGDQQQVEQVKVSFLLGALT